MRGRPTKYHPDLCEQVIEYMKQGHSLAEVAYLLDVNRDTIDEWRHTHKDFSEAVKKGVELSEGKWMMHGTENLHNKDFNSTLWYMNMKNRFKWSDKQESTHHVTVRQEDAIKELE